MSASAVPDRITAGLGIPAECIHSVAVFAGESTFKTPMPSHVTQGGGFVRYIQSFQNAVMTPGEVDAVVARIESGRLAPTRATHKAPVAQLKDRSGAQSATRTGDAADAVRPVSSAAATEARCCPKCGSPMVRRVAKRGTNAGKSFWGCSGYPQCRTVLSESGAS